MLSARPRAHSTRSISRSLLRRGCWTALLLIHIAPLLAATQSLVRGELGGGRLTSVAVLWLAVTFFALKIADVRFLRWRRHAGVLAFTVACALLHGEAARLKAGQALIDHMPVAMVGSLGCEAIMHTARRIPQWLSRMAASLRGYVQRLSVSARIEALALLGLAAARLTPLSIPRAPPA